MRGGASSVRKNSGYPPPALGCSCPETPSPPPGTKNVFFHQITSACGNVPGPKTQFSMKKRRLRQRTRTKNAFFQQKKAPAATYQDQKLFFSGTHFKKLVFVFRLLVTLTFWGLSSLEFRLLVSPGEYLTSDVGQQTLRREN